MRALLTASALLSLSLRVLALKCYTCPTPVDKKCQETECGEEDVCKSVLSRLENETFTERSCAIPLNCDFSFNTGWISQSTTCCETDGCNTQTWPETENAKRCYGCTDDQCREALTPISCLGQQDTCAVGLFKGSFRFRQKRFPFRGCVNKKMCSLPSASVYHVRCCRGDLCNSGSLLHQALPLLGTALLVCWNSLGWISHSCI